MLDSGLNMTETDQEQEATNENLAMETTSNSEIGDFNLRTLVDSNQTNDIDKNNLFFCYECKLEVTSFESFEKHMNNHFMEIENESNVATSLKISTGNIKNGNASCEILQSCCTRCHLMLRPNLVLE